MCVSFPSGNAAGNPSSADSRMLMADSFLTNRTTCPPQPWRRWITLKDTWAKEVKKQ